MIFYYVRHGDPIYDPDSLTPLGERQAEAVGRRLSVHGLDKIYASSSNRAQLTAKPACEMMKKEMEIVDFANESHAWRDFTIEEDGTRLWIFQNVRTKMLLTDSSVLALGNKWYEHPEFTAYKQGVDRVYNETYEFFKNLGYEHIRDSGKYRVLNSNKDRVALFAHQGFGIAFLSTILDIPYPIVANHFDITHSGVTIIEFEEFGDIAIPKILTLSSEAHIYKEGLPLKYNNVLDI